MSKAQTDLDPVDHRRKRTRGKIRGRTVEPDALLEVQSLLGDESRATDLLIEHLHKIQDAFGSLSAAHLVALASEMKLAPAEVYEVASFYHHFDVVKENELPPRELTVRVCDSLSCEMAGSENLITALCASLGEDLRVQRVPCVGRCDKAPVAVVKRNTIDQASVHAVRDAIDKRRFTQSMPADSIDFDAYRADGGYRLYDKLLAGEISGDAIIETLEASALRGLGGAGFPVGRKWRILRDQPAPRMCAVNIDEGEPGTFKDRFYMLRDPHRFLEGMLIAARAVGISHCYIYERD